MNNESLETLKAAYAKAQELGRTHVRFNESGKAAYFQVSAKNGAYSLQEIQDRIVDLDCPLEAVVFEDDEMPTDKEFDDLGFKFAVGDVVIGRLSGDLYVINETKADDLNNEMPDLFKIKSLAPRKNEGMQPCGDDCLVDVHFDTLSTSTNEADCYGWDFIGSDDITHWVPSKENFTKPQPAKLPETQVMEQGFKIESLQNDIKRLEALLADEKANHERTKSALAHKQDILDILQSTINLFQYK